MNAPATRSQPKETKLSVRIDLADRQKLRAAASLEGKKVQDWVNEVIRKELGRYDFSGVLDATSAPRAAPLTTPRQLNP